MKYIVILCGILGVCVGVLYFMLDNAQNRINTLQAEKNTLKMQVETNERMIDVYNKKSMEASKQIAELKATAIKSGDSCYNKPLSSALLNELRKPRASTSGKKNN